jgi:hypothetical protein
MDDVSNYSALRRWLLRIVASKRNVLIYGTCAFGIPFALMLVWLFRGYGGLGVTVFCAVIGLAGGYLWGLVMWVMFVEPRVRRLANQSFANGNDIES